MSINTPVKTPVEYNVVRQIIIESKLPSIGKASIREIRSLINKIEKQTAFKYIRMEMGVPGLPASTIGMEAEKAAIKNGVTNVYPSIEGIPELKREASRFAKLFMDVTIPEYCCIPCAGSTSGSFISFLVTARVETSKDYILFLDPGFPVHKQQLSVLGFKQKSLDVYDFRGDKLKNKLESVLSEGNVSTILFSNPNNPSWICFTDKELKIIGELCNKYNVICIEDLAYFKMDFRMKYSAPGEPPFQPSVSKYTENYILLISSSKIFSYAGERIGTIMVCEKLFNSEFEGLLRNYTSKSFGHSIIYGAAYAVSAGVAHSTQYALAAMLKAVNDGEYDFVSVAGEYGRRAKIIKKIFTENGFSLVYDRDDGIPIADGFYFTVSYPGFTGVELVEELLYYGISAISLANTGSTRKEGIRACVSKISNEQIPDLELRLKAFDDNHKN